MNICYLVSLFNVLYILNKAVYCVDPNLVTELEKPAVDVKKKQEGCRRSFKSPDDKEFRIAWLAPEQEYHNFSAVTSASAVKLALAFISKTDILHGYKLRYKKHSYKFINIYKCHHCLTNSQN